MTRPSPWPVWSNATLSQRCSLAAFFVVIACAISSPVAAGKFNVGFVTAPPTAQNPPMGIWYPSTSAEVAGKLGPFRPTWAWDGEAVNQSFPVIVLSHGHTGRYRNHRQTAAALARHGYVVVAPDHLLDRQMTSARKTVSVVTHRAKELSLALSAVAAHPRVGEIADINRVGAIGYSLGTLTTLYAAGATPQMARFINHCELNSEKDSNFCGDSSAVRDFFAAVKSALSWLKETKILRPSAPKQPLSRQNNEKEFRPIGMPIHFNAVALVAPVGVPFSARELRQLTVPVALFRLGDDDQLRYPYHAEYLRVSLRQNNPVYKNFPGVHHYAFISPLPQWLLEEEYIPVAIDPEGFDRAEFIRDINVDLVNFFNEHFYPG